MIGRHSLLFLLSLLSMACDLSAAFVATTSKRCSTMNFQAARLMPGAMAHHNFKRGLSMSEEGEQEKAPSPKSGTYYDDEVRILNETLGKEIDLLRH